MTIRSLLLILFTVLSHIPIKGQRRFPCRDFDPTCGDHALMGRCSNPRMKVFAACPFSCNRCRNFGTFNPAYDLGRLHVDLVPVKWLVGLWNRTNHNGFVSLGPFTFPEILDVKVSVRPEFGGQKLNLTGQTVNRDGSQYSMWGYIAVKNMTNRAAVITADNAGVVMTEEGTVRNDASLLVALRYVGRVGFPSALFVPKYHRSFVPKGRHVMEVTIKDDERGRFALATYRRILF